ncbi:MAG TPA: phosphoribosylformylglycinamidine cyclo-ligase [Planctomycetes bacterium]|nr:phosphoribosylformylglycinamidine cyclo-ligase [Planctomycetota bacterium]
MSESEYMTYARSGVSIDAGERMVERIAGAVASTHGPRVINLENGFAGFFRLDYDEKLFKKNYKNPVLVACSDGVGTKIKIGHMAGRLDTVGIDLVAMNVNDMIVHGAEPLFFLDYLAVNKLEPEGVAQMVEGVAAGCRQANCALIGGETAEMPDIYRRGEFDMAGFAVGVVEKGRIINGANMQKGDVILGLASSGLHSNGYTLARDICFNKAGLKVNDTVDELDGAVLGDVLLEPTRIYVKPIVKLLAQYKVKKVVRAMAHITGGGLVGNIPRVLPKECNAVINKSSWTVPGVFSFLQKAGPVEENEMFRVFNMGIGYVLIVAPDFAGSIAKKLKRYGETVYKIGTITTGIGKVVLK